MPRQACLRSLVACTPSSSATPSATRRRASTPELCEQLAPAVASVGGLASATWLTNPVTGRYGAVFVFETKPDFDRFVASELFARSARTARSTT
jgi:hypothetical protein